jgi:hypothetical protein
LTTNYEQVFDSCRARSSRRGIVGVNRILDQNGDTTVAWDVYDLESIRVAEELFARLTAERKIPFARAVGAPAEEAVQIREFDPNAEEIIWVRPIAGG